jgi:hypothetical protein
MSDRPRKLRRHGAARRRLERLVRDGDPGTTITVSVAEVRDLIGDLERCERLLAGCRGRIAQALQAHAEGGPAALEAALGLQPRDGRATLSAETQAAALTVFWYEVVRNGRRADEGVSALLEQYPKAWHSRAAVRAFLRRSVAALRDPESALSKTWGGAILRGQLDRLRLPGGQH